jgi:hypothetical protein
MVALGIIKHRLLAMTFALSNPIGMNFLLSEETLGTMM